MNTRPIPGFSAHETAVFWSHVQSSDPDTCWLWQLARDKNGYGKYTIRRISLRAHRIAYFLHYHVDPAELLVCHTCDNPRCCNPHHLFLGTEQDNILDARDKNRLNTASGARHGTKTKPDSVVRGEQRGSKLTEQQVIEIRRLYSDERKTQQEIANQFGVTRENISVIIRGVNWQHVDKTNLSENARRGKSGEANGSAKLNADSVRLIRQLYAAGGQTYESLAERFHVSFVSIRFVVIRHTWKHVE